METIPIENRSLNEGYALEIVKQGSNAWSYKIYYGGELQIKQEFIPGVSGNKHFFSEEEAERIGILVLERLSNRESPTVTEEDLRKNAITYKN